MGNEFDDARERAKARMRTGLDLGWRPPASRDELHEREKPPKDSEVPEPNLENEVSD